MQLVGIQIYISYGSTLKPRFTHRQSILQTILLPVLLRLQQPSRNYLAFWAHTSVSAESLSAVYGGRWPHIWTSALNCYEIQLFFFRILQWFCLISKLGQSQFDGYVSAAKSHLQHNSSWTVNLCFGPRYQLAKFANAFFFRILYSATNYNFPVKWKHQLDATLCRFYFCRVTLHSVASSWCFHLTYTMMQRRTKLKYNFPLPTVTKIILFCKIIFNYIRNVLSYFNHKFLKDSFSLYVLYVITDVNNWDYYRLQNLVSNSLSLAVGFEPGILCYQEVAPPLYRYMFEVRL